MKCECTGFVHIIGPGDMRCRCGHPRDTHEEEGCTVEAFQ